MNPSTAPPRILIEASILAADFARLGEEARQAEAAGADGLQIDVMDGRFVPNFSFGPGVVRALRAENLSALRAGAQRGKYRAA